MTRAQMKKNKLQILSELSSIINSSVSETFSKKDQVLKENYRAISTLMLEKEDIPVEDQVPAEIKYNMIKNLIDAMRAGRSLKDPDIKINMVNYYDNLDEPERIALYQYLYAIADILTAGASWKETAYPGKPPGKVETQRTGDNKVKAPPPSKTKARSSDSDILPTPEYINKNKEKQQDSEDLDSKNKRPKKIKKIRKTKKKKSSLEITPPIMVKKESHEPDFQLETLREIIENNKS